jgi:hypothetical protein
MVHDPALTAGQLQRVSQTQDQLVGIVRERIGWQDPNDPRALAIVGAALSCLIAAKTTWISNQARPFGDLSTKPWARSDRHPAPWSGPIPNDNGPGPENARPTDPRTGRDKLIPAVSGEEKRKIGEPGGTPRFLPVPPAGIEPPHAV